MCGCARAVPAKSHNNLIGRLLMVHFFFPVPLAAVSLSLSHSLTHSPLSIQQVNTQRKAIVQLILEKRELLVGQRVKRDGSANRAFLLLSHPTKSAQTQYTPTALLLAGLFFPLLSVFLPFPLSLFLWAGHLTQALASSRPTCHSGQV